MAEQITPTPSCPDCGSALRQPEDTMCVNGCKLNRAQRKKAWGDFQNLARIAHKSSLLKMDQESESPE